MSAGMQRVLTLVFLIAAGFCLKRTGILQDSARKALGTVFTYITFPSVIISSYSSFNGDLNLLWIILLGLIAGLAMMCVMVLLCRARSKEDLATAAMSCSSVSIGAFAVPFLQVFLTADQLLLPIFYDIGNGMMAYGGSIASGQIILRKSGEKWYLTALNAMLRSAPVWAFALGLLYHLLIGKLPEGVYTALNFIGGANSVLAMLFIGCSLEFPHKPGIVSWMIRLLIIHYGTVAALAVLFYYLLPFPQTVRAILAVILFSPLSVGGLVAVDNMGLDRDTAGLMNTITILIGIVAVTMLIPAVGLA